MSLGLIGERASDTLVEEGLPNLKIEIENDISQRMETDEDDASSEKGVTISETEEGEVVDDDDGLGDLINGKPNPAQCLTSQIVPTGRSILKYDTKEYVELQQQTATVKNPNGAFVTGVDIFSPEEQAKLDKRAQRFGIEASEAKVLTEKLLKKLYKSMCVKPSDKNIRTEALHMRGTEQMTTQDVFGYFKDYGPASLEWINDNSCNVVWLDDISAARALLGLSVHISGQTAPTTQRRSSQSDSDVEMEAQPAEEQANDTENLSEESDAVAESDLGVELPPGRWRRGAPHPLSPCILLRFATTADRSLPRPGNAKFGNHEFGGYVGLISESRRRRMLHALPTPIMFDDVGDEIISKPSLDDKDNTNPWGSLAKTWSQFDKVRQPRPPSPIIERILPLPPRMTPPPSPPMFSSRPKLVARRRPPTVAITRRGSDNSSDDSEWCSRNKLPRMRMHADDEEKKLEKKLKRTRQNRSLSHSPARPGDLRKRLGGAVGGGKFRSDRGETHRSDGEGSSEPEPVAEEPGEDDEIPDLRVAVAAERPTSPEDSKTGIRQNLFQCGNVKSVLRGARGHSENDEEEEESEDEEKRSSRRHRSRSKERRRHHRRHKKESHHKSRRKSSDSDSNERAGKTVRSAIKRISPEKERRTLESRERRWEKRSPRHEERRRKKEDSYRRSESGQKSERRGHEESRSSKDLRSKLSHKHKAYDSNNEFRSKSPLQIEIDNDEYYSRTVESD